jgi:hypothetical protein
MPRFAPWYRHDDYALVREIMEDRETFPLDFDEWEKNAESEQASAKRDGVNIIPVLLDPDEFFTFCKEKKISPNSVTAAEFAKQPRDGELLYGSVIVSPLASLCSRGQNKKAPGDGALLVDRGSLRPSPCRWTAAQRRSPV